MGLIIYEIAITRLICNPVAPTGGKKATEEERGMAKTRHCFEISRIRSSKEVKKVKKEDKVERCKI